VLAGVATGEVEGDHLQALSDLATDLDQPQAKGAELEVRHAEPSQPAAKCVEEPVGGTVQEQPELVGPEPMAAQAIGEAVIASRSLMQSSG
jgi:hypothetical protein